MNSSTDATDATDSSAKTKQTNNDESSAPSQNIVENSSKSSGANGRSPSKKDNQALSSKVDNEFIISLQENNEISKDDKDEIRFNFAQTKTLDEIVFNEDKATIISIGGIDIAHWTGQMLFLFCRANNERVRKSSKGKKNLINYLVNRNKADGILRRNVSKGGKTKVRNKKVVSSQFKSGEDSGVETSFSYEPNEFVTAYDTLRGEILENSNELSSTSRNDSSSIIKNQIIKVAAVQLETIISSGMNGSTPAKDFLNRAVDAVEKAVSEKNANLVLLQELFMGPYFCQSQEAVMFALAESDIEGKNHIVSIMQNLAKKHNVVLPVSLFEQKNNAFYNSVVMIDADGSNLGTYRKTHIPDGTGYQEKFYFSPGDTGFKVFNTKVGKVGVGICWDQWFPEAARSMTLMGADIILYPTAIGTEPQDPSLNSADHWQRVMQGHAAANMVPVVASNRFGTEVLLDSDGNEKQRINFYGRSFITDETGAIVEEANDGSDIISSEIDTQANRCTRAAWGLFRDRRPEMYGILKTKDGHLQM